MAGGRNFRLEYISHLILHHPLQDALQHNRHLTRIPDSKPPTREVLRYPSSLSSLSDTYQSCVNFGDAVHDSLEVLQRDFVSSKVCVRDSDHEPVVYITMRLTDPKKMRGCLPASN